MEGGVMTASKKKLPKAKGRTCANGPRDKPMTLGEALLELHLERDRKNKLQNEVSLLRLKLSRKNDQLRDLLDEIQEIEHRPF
jgi:hypothetical protein